MASISPPTTPPNQLFLSSRASTRLKILSYPPHLSSSRLFGSVSGSTLRCCSNSSDTPPVQWRWDAVIQEALKSAMKRFDSYMSSLKSAETEPGRVKEKERGEREGKGKDEWDWDRWKKHFDEVDEQERLVSVLKSQLGNAVRREDYAEAARLKVAIAAAATNDTVGRVMSRFNRAIEEERYRDAAFLRDNASTGLVGWWSGISNNVRDPYGLIIRITPEHGRYVARSYTPRQLATAATGAPLFEIFLTKNKKGEYKQQAVYLKRKEVLQDPSTLSSKALDATSYSNPLSPSEDTEDGSDLAEGQPGFQNILRDMIPGMKIKVLKVTSPVKVDRDFISKVIELIDEDDEEDEDDEDDEDSDFELEDAEMEDESKSGSDQEKDVVEFDSVSGIIDNEGGNEISVEVVIGLPQKFSGSLHMEDTLRVPAKLEKKGRRSFSFSIEKDVSPQDAKEPAPVDKAKLRGQRSADHIMLDLAKLIGSEKIPLKVLKDVGELINLTLGQFQNYQPLSGSTTFHRIEASASADPLNGLYLGAHGPFTSEVIHLQRKHGQWQDGRGNGASDLEFYEYVEAVKITGDPYIPAGQVAFRAKVGKRYQLPHKGIIPEEFGMIARYKGQGRLAEPGFKNPRWVDGELVILDGKYIKGGPVVGFVYWAPEYHFLVFFNRLRLQ